MPLGEPKSAAIHSCTRVAHGPVFAFFVVATGLLVLSSTGCKFSGAPNGLYGSLNPPTRGTISQPYVLQDSNKTTVAKPIILQTQTGTYPYPAANRPQARVAQLGNGFDVPPPQIVLPETQPRSVNGGVLPNQYVPNQNAPLGSGQYFPNQQPVVQPNPGQSYFPVLPQQGAVAPQSFPQQPGYQLTPGMNPNNTLDLDVIVPQTTGTGRLNVGGTYSSDNGLVGQIIIDERDFDFRRWPRNLREAFGPSAWRGAGQHFRLEIVPGDELERYLVSLSFPYFRNSDWSLGLSGYYHDRQFLDWDEERAGGRISLGRKLNEFLSFNSSLRMENVEIDNPRLGTSPQLNADLGDHELYLASFGLVYDSRVTPFVTPEGSYLGLKFTQGFGDFDFSKGEIDFRNHRMMYQRPDFTGRHTIGFRTKLGFSGSDTPVFENFLAGGSSTLRGFDFRGVSPIEGGVRVGGEFQWLNTLEYTFPLTQDDMVYGTAFVDFGTVEESIELNSENFRVAPGLGLRINLPYAGLGGAPFAIDFAFPVSDATGDEKQTVSFFFGAFR